LPFIRGEQSKPADFSDMLGKETQAVFAKQIEAGIDLVNDGELGRRDYVTAARQRLTGFGAKKSAVGAADLEEMTEYSDKLEGRKGLLTLTKKTEVENPACNGEIEFTHEGLKDLQEEVDRVCASAKTHGIPLQRVFFSVTFSRYLGKLFP